MKLIEKQKVIALRKEGHTLSEIQKLVSASKSTISLWMQEVSLSPEGKKRISDKITLGQLRSREVLHKKLLLKLASEDKFVNDLYSSFKIDKYSKILICAALYGCEGLKNKKESLGFTNSDPYLIQIFMKLLRSSFKLDERKFSVCVHLHDYHNKRIQLEFWSKITQIPLAQFMKPYMKNSLHSYKKDGYPGCISVRYYDISIKRRLMTIFKKIGNNI